jgi:hypothetical protein
MGCGRPYRRSALLLRPLAATSTAVNTPSAPGYREDFEGYSSWQVVAPRSRKRRQQHQHWQELIQVVLSIHKGKVFPSWLIQKLVSNNPKNKRYLALRELGCVIRTLFLLEFASNAPLRAQIQAATTKIEAYNLFSQWIFFGGDSLIKSRDPVEYDKRIKYKDLIANAIMLHNVVDMTNVLHDLSREGFAVTSEGVATFSPYITEHIKRFGEYFIDTSSIPPPLQPDKLFLLEEIQVENRNG